MTMTLREFTKDCEKNCKLPEANSEWRGTDEYRTFDKEFTDYKNETNIFGFSKTVKFTKTVLRLERLWLEVHKGEIIHRDWREVYHSYR